MLLTYGHGTDSAERTTALLADAGVVSLVDIRIAPGSKRHPQFARAAMEEWLPAAGIGYRWEKRLGGFRKPSQDNPDVTWREPMFRGYAEYMRGDELPRRDRHCARRDSARRDVLAETCSPRQWATTTARWR